MTLRAAIYTRVSTHEQTTDNQMNDLRDVLVRQRWSLGPIYTDVGISGAKGRDARPGLDALLKAVARKDFDVLVVWSVDRLGRSLSDLLSILTTLHEKHIGLFIHNSGLDTTTAAGKALFSMMGVFAEFERETIKARVKAGLARAKSEGRIGGRPRVGKEVEAAIIKERRKKKGILRIARDLGVGVGTVQRVLKQAPPPLKQAPPPPR